jgi:hypothetical protein
LLFLEGKQVLVGLETMRDSKKCLYLTPADGRSSAFKEKPFELTENAF